MTFEWDENKNRTNKKKHGISFELASRVLLDDKVRTGRSDRKSEERYKAIGEVKNRIITVVYTLRGRSIRIISARKASKNERRKYHKV